MSLESVVSKRKVVFQDPVSQGEWLALGMLIYNIEIPRLQFLSHFWGRMSLLGGFNRFTYLPRRTSRWGKFGPSKISTSGDSSNLADWHFSIARWKQSPGCSSWIKACWETGEFLRRCFSVWHIEIQNNTKVCLYERKGWILVRQQ